MVDQLKTQADVAHVEATLELPEDEVTHVTRVIKGYRQRKAKITFGGAYDGMWVKVWTNCPRKLIKRLSNDDSEVVDKAFCEFVIEHNLTWDDNDEPLPTPLTMDAVDAVPFDLYLKIVQLGIEGVQEAAKSSKSD